MSSLEIEESALTGESLPVSKMSDSLSRENLGIGDMENMAFMGTMVTRGSGVGCRYWHRDENSNGTNC